MQARTRHLAHTPGGAATFFSMQWILLTIFASVWLMCSITSRCHGARAAPSAPRRVAGGE